MRKSFPSDLLFFSILLLSTSHLFAGEKVTLPSYNPSPSNTYDRIRLQPRDPYPDTECDTEALGTIYTKNTDFQPYLCRDLNDGNGPQWGLIGSGLWAHDQNSDSDDILFPLNTDTYTNLKVGIGLIDPDAQLVLFDDEPVDDPVPFELRIQNAAADSNSRISFVEGAADVDFAIEFDGNDADNLNHLHFWGKYALAGNASLSSLNPILSLESDFSGTSFESVGIGTPTGDTRTAKLEIRNHQSGVNPEDGEPLLLLYDESTANPVFFVDDEAFVGIGVTGGLGGPGGSADLHIQSVNEAGIKLEGSNPKLVMIDSSSASQEDWRFSLDNGQLRLDVRDSSNIWETRAVLASSGDVGLGYNLSSSFVPENDLHLQGVGRFAVEGPNPSLLFDFEHIAGDNESYRISTDNSVLRFYEWNDNASSFANIHTIHADGRVGIGTSQSPAATLHIADPGAVGTFSIPRSTDETLEILDSEPTIRFMDNSNAGTPYIWDVKLNNNILTMGVDGKDPIVVITTVPGTISTQIDGGYGAVGIGKTPIDGVLLDVNGHMRLVNGEYRINGACVTASCAISSDERLKTDLHPLPDGSLDKITLLSPVSFQYKEEPYRNEPDRIGLIAQDVENIFPDWVREDNSGIKRIAYQQELAVHLIQAIKELNSHAEKELNGLNQRLKTLRLENQKLKEQIHHGF